MYSMTCYTYSVNGTHTVIIVMNIACAVVQPVIDA